MQAEELKRLGGLVFQRMEEGLEYYEHEVISGTLEELKDLIIKHIHCNGWENSYVDFYYGSLKEEEKERVRKVVPKEWHKDLEAYEKNTDIYYPLDEKILELTWFLTSKEYLFSTYYFCKEACTIWGNYNHTLVKFYPSD